MPEKTLVVRLFNLIPLALKAVADRANFFHLPRAVTLSKGQIAGRITQFFKIPPFILQLLPNQLSIKRLLFNQSSRPNEVEVDLEIDLSDWFKQHQEVVRYGGASLNLKTDQKIISEGQEEDEPINDPNRYL